MTEHEPAVVLVVARHPEATPALLRRDLLGRLRNDASVPVEHVEGAPAPAEVGA